MEKNNGDKPPIFKSWKQFYALVLGVLLLLIGVFSWISSLFA